MIHALQPVWKMHGLRNDLALSAVDAESRWLSCCGYNVSFVMGLKMFIDLGNKKSYKGDLGSQNKWGEKEIDDRIWIANISRILKHLTQTLGWQKMLRLKNATERVLMYSFDL